MIGSSAIGPTIFLKSDSIYSLAFDVLIKFLEGLSTSEPKKIGGRGKAGKYMREGEEREERKR